MSTAQEIREAFFKARPVRRVKVELPELGEGVAVFVRAMNESERTAFELEVFGDDGQVLPEAKPLIKRKLVVATAEDFDGNRVFAEGDIDALAEQDALPVNRIFDAAQRLSFSKRDIKTLEGN